MSGNPSMEQEAASVAFEQAAWWRSKGLRTADVAKILGLNRRAGWLAIEYALRRRWRESIQIKAHRDHRSAA